MLPKSPSTWADIIEVFKHPNVMESYGMTLKNGEDENSLPPTAFYKTAYECKAFSYVVFSFDNIVNAIERIPKNRRKFFMDATFKVCPYGIYNQLLVIYMKYLGEVNLCIFLCA